MIDTFINEITDSEKVFILEDKNGIAFTDSLFFNDENNAPIAVICFWSELDVAQQNCVSGWEDYKVREVCLVTFIEDYLIQIYNDSLIVGINFNEKMEGHEADPLDLTASILSVLKKKNKQLEFEYFKNLLKLVSFFILLKTILLL